MDWTSIWVAIISGLVSSFSAILVFIGNENVRKQKVKEQSEAQLKELEDSITSTLSEHRKEYLDGIDKITKRLDEVDGTITNIQAVYQQNTAVIELKIQTLSDHVEKHNNVVERTYNLESKTGILSEKIKYLENK